MTAPYTLFIANKNYSSWSLRPWVLMKTLNIAFQEQLEPFAEQDNRTKFRQFSPTGTVPCLQTANEVVWDSLAIIEYLAEQHAGVWPSDPAARAWARCATAEMHSGFAALRNDCSMSCGQRITLHTVSADLQTNLNRIDELWREGLTRFGGPFLAGNTLTAVDAFYAPVAFRIRTYNLTLSQMSLDYAEHLLALPAMQEWEQAALKETWRHTQHEQDIANCGNVIDDFRAQ